MQETIKDVLAHTSTFFRRPTAADTLTTVVHWVSEMSTLNQFVEENKEHATGLVDALATEVFLKPTGTAGSNVPLTILCLQLLDTLCDNAAMKFYVARKWGQATLTFIGDVLKHHYEVSRACCSLLVNVIKGSDARSHFTDLSCLAGCIKDSSDIYVQLQCMEIIYYVTRTSHQAMVTVSDVLGQRFAKLMEKLPNNNKMLQMMVETLRTVSTQMCAVKVTHITCGAIKRDAAVAHFGKTMVVLDWKEADLTIPYELIRSVKLSRTKELVLKIQSVPLSMLKFFPENTTDLTVSLGITDEEFKRMKDSNVQQWISKEMHNGATQHQHQQLSQPSQPMAVDDTQREKRKLSNTTTVVHDVVAQHDDTAASYLPPVPTSPEAKRRTSPSQKENAPTVLFPQSTAPAAPVVTAIPVTSSRPLQQYSQVQTNSQYQQSQHHQQRCSQNDISTELDPLLSQLRDIVTQRVSTRQQEGMDIMAAATNRIQDEIEQLRKKNGARYNDYTALMNSELAKVRSEQAQLKARMTKLVDKLNADVTDLNSQNTMVAEHVTSMELEFAQSLQEMKKMEEDAIQQMNQRMEGEMQMMERKIHDAVMSSNPLRFVTQYLSSQNNGVASNVSGRMAALVDD